MNIRKLFFIAVLLVCQVNNVFTQTDTIFRTVTSKEAINLNLLWYSVNHGAISWEKSTDAISWTDIPGEVTKNFRFSAESDSYYRAKVLSGTCDPVYSRITNLKVLNLSTDSVGNVTNDQAIVYCTFDLDTLLYPERGIFYDTKTVPDLSSPRIIALNNQNSFSASLTNLQEGKTYYVRVYAINTEGNYFNGNIISFSSQKIAQTNILNVTQTTAQLFYTISSTPAPTEHGVLFSPDVLPDINSARIPGVFENGNYSATLTSVAPGSHNYLQPYMIVEGNYYFGEVQKIKTLSDYSDFIVDNNTLTVNHKIIWNDPVTARKISQDGSFGDYGRIKRIGTTDTLVLVYHGGPNYGDWLNIYMRLSYDNGSTWKSQKTLMNIQDHNTEYWRFCTPEVLVLQNGWVLISYEANAKPDENKSSVQILISKDTCKTFEGPVIYPTGRTWEPSMVQLPNGEIEMFYSSEEKWWPGDPVYQEIRQTVSTDNGYSWSESRVVAYYPEKRDGMAVPLLLQGNKGVVFCIESVNSALSPFVIKRDLASPWNLTTSNFYSGPYRWVVNNFSGHGGAPYFLQLPSGEVILSAHIYRGGDWHQNNYMQVITGDNNAKNFSQLSTPWGVLPVNESAVNNSLFLKDDETVVAVSCRMFKDGSGGVYWLEGKIIPLK
jgi:hypothetical protein